MNNGAVEVLGWFDRQSWDMGRKVGMCFPFIKMTDGKWELESLNDIPKERLNGYGNIVDGNVVWWNWTMNVDYEENTIDLINISVSHREMGLGSFFMNVLCRLCDYHQVSIRIPSIKPFGIKLINGKRKLYKKELLKWYRSFGFKIDYQNSSGFRVPKEKEIENE